MRMTPEEAANAIRQDIDPNVHQKISPDMQRSISFINRVAGNLGLNASNPVVFDHIAKALDRRSIEHSAMNEFPKMVTEDDGSHVILKDAAEQAAYNKAKKPTSVAVPKEKTMTKKETPVENKQPEEVSESTDGQFYGE